MTLSACISAATAIQGSVDTEVRLFDRSAGQENQGPVGLSWALQGQWRQNRDDDKTLEFLLSPYLRFDAVDSASRYLDLREARADLRIADNLFRLGFDVVRWGAVESNQLVDVVNQLDLRADVDGKAKLGQPMVAYSRFFGSVGRLDLMWLPLFRPRPFAGSSNRLSGGLTRASDVPDHGLGRFLRDDGAAMRWSGQAAGADWGLSHYRGLSREPSFALGRAPVYRSIRQTGLDLQWPIGKMLWKMEVMHRRGQGRPFIAWIGGGEYTIGQPEFDLGLLLEVTRDGRDATAPPTRFADGWFFGVRIGVADAGSSEMLWGVLRDRQGASWAHKLEVSRRFGDHWRLSVVGRKVVSNDPSGPYAVLERESHVQATLKYSF